jgi:ribokinase
VVPGSVPKGGAEGPIAVVGSHIPGLFVYVSSIPREGETVLAWGFDEPEDGGKATNQAVAAAKLGAPVRVVTLLGDDERGRRWRDVLTRYGIDTTFAETVEGPTDVGFVMLPPSRVPAIASSMDRSRGLDAAFVEAAAHALRDVSVVLCQLEAPPSCAEAAFRLGRRAGACTILNPAPAVPIGRELLALTDVLVPNEHEAAALAGVDAAPEELASILSEDLLEGRPAIVTAGADGVWIGYEGTVVHEPAPVVDPVDTTGAGDAFVAALSVRLRTGGDLLDAASFAVRAASLSVTRPGTMPAFAAADELASLEPAST